MPTVAEKKQGHYEWQQSEKQREENSLNVDRCLSAITKEQYAIKANHRNSNVFPPVKGKMKNGLENRVSLGQWWMDAEEKLNKPYNANNSYAA